MRKDALENRQKILNISRKLFEKQDIDSIGMKEISDAAGIGIGTLYRNYENKSALSMALVYDDMETFIEKNSNALADKTLTGVDQFKTILMSYLNFREKNMQLLNSVENDSQQGTIFYQSDIYQELVNLFKGTIKKVSPDLTNQELTFKADMLIAMLKSDIYSFERTYRGLSQGELLDNIVKLFK
ncbi:TetR/AcrR family transcriptional regulator [Companilactobacillus sp.]|jgi:AcrR family transcriptional regulator|uniref:TetR/AcrR family transcriptional regulator n=1 Tax=Companilactobacillus sp. TaxID=2767905 RepID=UPI0025BD0839|nr:TetR/AcrR family transcriptional regulator [Companilactobacillus sp.]MCH4009649.1 TetR/AcrR family transcriptional regulator [Companilactobacillus sp.]MCH4052675.1 TetR/AcrR family transcriptional regulator [Companilactobacillus sp.]MCH4077591.1 TetR/AcrR family transcriptional regulator [Companilactobacillus sp.]MCH4126167.1 TetR/AcrR family transcriptional regulator [Companilactobacillus sp.]MCI1311875.1 TetR/AcrR family transcriptional regulator [Companilactobacillus sp.]